MAGETQSPDNIETSSAAALADLEARFGSGAAPESSGEAAIRARFRNRPALATPERRKNPLERLRGLRDQLNQTQLPFMPRRTSHTEEPEAQRESPFAGIFRGAISGVKDNLGRAAGGLIGLKDRIPSVSPEASQQLAEQFQQRASQVNTFGHSLWEMIRNPGGLVKAAWESKTEIGIGAAVGAITKEAAKWAFNMILAEPGTLLARAGVGAVGGAAVAGVKELRRQDKEYRQFAVNLSRELGGNYDMRDLARRYHELIRQLAGVSDRKEGELILDKLRYTAVFLKESRRPSIGKKEKLDTFLKSLEEEGSGFYNAQRKDVQRRRIEQASSIQLGRLGKKVMRGAAFGAAGAIAGGLLVDFIHGHFEAAGSAVPGASATESTSTPRPALTQAQPTETPTPSRPTATAVPVEATPAVPRPPAPAPEVQAAVPPPAPATPAEPQPPAVPAAPEAPAAAPAPIQTESLPPTTAPTGAEVSGSVVDNSLTYEGKPWVLMDNGVKNIGNLFKTVGESGDIDKQALASNLQNATNLWTHGQLNYTDHPDLYRIFHLSNGTGSVYNNLLDDNTLESLKKLGIVRK